MIVIEAIDGAGKSTLAKRASKELNLKLFSYPDRNSLYWPLISKFLSGEVALSPEELFFIYASDIIKDKDKWTKDSILDRYITSTIAYQCALGFPLDLAISIASKIFPKPRKIIYIDISPEVSLSRKASRDALEKVEILSKVRATYNLLAKKGFMCEWITIDGNKSEEEVYKDFASIIRKLI
ncbi:MAG: dTMP kinase [Conexivisphaerales archaeon]